MNAKLQKSFPGRSPGLKIDIPDEVYGRLVRILVEAALREQEKLVPLANTTFSSGEQTGRLRRVKGAVPE